MSNFIVLLLAILPVKKNPSKFTLRDFLFVGVKCVQGLTYQSHRDSRNKTLKNKKNLILSQKRSNPGNPGTTLSQTPRSPLSMRVSRHSPNFPNPGQTLDKPWVEMVKPWVGKHKNHKNLEI